MRMMSSPSLLAVLLWATLLLLWDALSSGGSLSSPSSRVFVVVEAAHSRLSYVVRRREREPQYDQTIAEFSKEGRLLQVEYGLTASEKGSPAVVIHTTGQDDDDDDDSNHSMLIVAKSANQVLQIDEHVLLVASGLLGDAQWLANVLRQYCQQFRTEFQEAPTLSDVAQYAAELYHTLTRQAGHRPLGCAVILVDTTISSGSTCRRPMMIHVGQAGAMESGQRIWAIGKDHQEIVKSLMAEQQQRSKSGVKGKQPKSNENTRTNTALVKAVLQAMNLKDDETVVVWKIQPPENKEMGNDDGNNNNHQTSLKSKISCLLNVDKQNCQ